jgi:dienelactone hydrolase
MAGKLDPICEASVASKPVFTPSAEDGEGAGKGAGQVEAIGDLSVYVVGKGPRCVVLIYDAFGFEPANTRSNCDALAEAGFMVLMPDIFRGTSRHTEGWKPPPPAAVDAEILDVIIPFAVKRGARVLGILGFCFGGEVAMRLSSSGRFAAAGGIHAGGLGGGVGEALVEKTTCPIMLQQAGNDPPLAGVLEVVKAMDATSSDVVRHSVLRTYWDMTHGFCGATGDRKTDKRLRHAVQTTLATTIDFFERTLRFLNAD